jgi:hypothetical protein
LILTEATEQVLKFQTDQLADVRKLDELHRFFLALMSGQDEEAAASLASSSRTAAGPSQKHQTRKTRRN